MHIKKINVVYVIFVNAKENIEIEMERDPLFPKDEIYEVIISDF